MIGVPVKKTPNIRSCLKDKLGMPIGERWTPRMNGFIPDFKKRPAFRVQCTLL